MQEDVKFSVNLRFFYGRDRSAVGLFEEEKRGRGRGSSGPVKKEVKFVLKLNFCSRVQEGGG